MHYKVHIALKKAIGCYLRAIDLTKAQWTPKNAKKNWTSDEIAKLKDAYDEGMPLNTIALMMQRPERSIVSRLRDLGIEAYKGIPTHWCGRGITFNIGEDDGPPIDKTETAP
jgi:hypothetical protein